MPRFRTYRLIPTVTALEARSLLTEGGGLEPFPAPEPFGQELPAPEYGSTEGDWGEEWGGSEGDWIDPRETS